jgi:hypothetical protein
MADTKSDAILRITESGEVHVENVELLQRLEAARTTGNALRTAADDTNYICPKNLYCPPKVLEA